MPGSSLKSFAREVWSEVLAVHIVLHEVGPLVDVHADAVADAVGEVFEAGAVAAVDDDLAGGGINVGGRHAGTRGFECGGLRAMDEIEDGLHLVGGLPRTKVRVMSEV